MPRNAAGSTLPLWTEAKNCLFLVKNGCVREAKFQRPLSGSELEQLTGESRRLVGTWHDLHPPNFQLGSLVQEIFSHHLQDFFPYM